MAQKKRVTRSTKKGRHKHTMDSAALPMELFDTAAERRDFKVAAKTYDLEVTYDGDQYFLWGSRSDLQSFVGDLVGHDSEMYYAALGE